MDKSFSELTDQEFLELVQALDNNEITTANLNWQVGDSRTVSLSAFTSYPDGTASTQAAQAATMVILNVGGKTFNGNGTSLDGQTCHYIVGFKDNVAKSHWDDSENTYSSSLLKTVEENVYNALPADVKACFKKFDVVTGTSNYAIATTQQYFTSAAEKEIFGGSSRTYSYTKEFTSLSQFTYYATANNRKHSNLSTYWWERSPSCNSSSSACYVYSDGTAYFLNVSGDNGVSPYGCI